MAFLKNINIDALKGTIEAGVKAAQEGLEDGAKLAQQKIGEGVKAAQDGAAGLSVDDIVQGARNAVAAGTAAVGDAVGSLVGKDDEAQEGATFKDFVSLLWCLASIDGTVSPEERETLHQIASELDPEYAAYATEVEQEFAAKLERTAREFGQPNASKIEAQKIIEDAALGASDARLLCWNLLALANSDGLDESESDFIRYATEQAGVGAAAFDELRNHSDALVEIQGTIEHLKLSGRPYAEIEPLVAELTTRQQVVLEAIQALVTDR